MLPSGYNTINTNNIRLWRAQPKRGFNLQSFNAGDYDGSVREGENAETSRSSYSLVGDHTDRPAFTQSLEFCTQMTSEHDHRHRLSLADKPPSAIGPASSSV